MKKKIIGLLICVLVVASLAGGVSANGASGNGYSSASIYYNGVPYTLTMATQFSKTAGVRTMVNCEAPVIVSLSNVEVEYRTINYGNIRNIGGAQKGQLDPEHGVNTIYSKYVVCSKGMAQVIKYNYIRGSATIESSHNNYTFSVYAY